MGSLLEDYPLQASKSLETCKEQLHLKLQDSIERETTRPNHSQQIYAEYDDYVAKARLELAARDHDDLATLAIRDGRNLRDTSQESFLEWEAELLEKDYARHNATLSDSLDPVMLQNIHIRNEMRSLDRSLAKLSPDDQNVPAYLRPMLERVGAQLQMIDPVAMDNMQLGQRFKLPTRDGSGVKGEFDPRELLPYPKCINNYESLDSRNIEPFISTYLELLSSKSEERLLIVEIVQRTVLAISGFIKSQIFKTRNEINLLRRASLQAFPQTRFCCIGPITSEEYLGWAVYSRRPAEDILTISPNAGGVYTQNSHKLSLWTLTPTFRNGSASWLYPTISCCLSGSISPRMERLNDPLTELGKPELNAIATVLSALETSIKARDSLARELILEHFGVPNCPYYFIYSRIAVQTKFAWRLGKVPSQVTKISFFVESKVEYDLDIREHLCRETAAWLNREIQNGLLVRLEI